MAKSAVDVKKELEKYIPQGMDLLSAPIEPLTNDPQEKYDGHVFLYKEFLKKIENDDDVNLPRFAKAIASDATVLTIAHPEIKRSEEMPRGLYLQFPYGEMFQSLETLADLNGSLVDEPKPTSVEASPVTMSGESNAASEDETSAVEESVKKMRV